MSCRPSTASRRSSRARCSRAVATSSWPATDGEADLLARAEELLETSLRPVINATGVILHTNLGRAPLARAARAAVQRVAGGYSNLEYDLAAGERGSRRDHVSSLLCELTGAEAALAVNNCAGAVTLAAAALAGGGRELIVSRGQLIEIGGSFRIPEVVAQAGARLVEVGTTNRTRLSDYDGAIGSGTGAILRAHPSNFRTLGFVEEVEIEELCALPVPVIDDVGSGVLADEIELLADEPPVRRSVRAGAALVCFSGDKLLGGPQAGLIVGRAEAVATAARHPLARALRIDKLSLAALEATLALYRDPEAAAREIPALAMLLAPREELERRARVIMEATGGELVEVSSRVGGGALPLHRSGGSRRQRRPRARRRGRSRRVAAGAHPARDRADPRGTPAARPAHALRRGGGARGAGRAAR